MESNVLVSICCITYNHEAYISEAIEGFLMQKTDFNYEILIGEDCSTDNTLSIIMEYKRNFPDIIKIITSQENVGAQKNSWRTRDQAKGKYIAYCEGDDYWTDPYKLQKQVDFMEANPEYSICGHDIKIIDVILNKEIDANFFKKCEKNMDLPFDFLGDGLFFHTSTMLIRREYIKRGYPKFYELSPYGDLAIQLWMGHLGKVYYFNEAMSVYNVFTPSSWQLNRSRNELFKIEEIKKLLHMLNEFNEYSNRKHQVIIQRKIDKYSGLMEVLEQSIYLKYIDRVIDVKVPKPFKNIKGKHTFIFAASIEGKSLLDLLKEEGVQVKGFIDNNVDLQGKYIKGKRVYSIKNIDKNAVIIVSSTFYAEEITTQLKELGYKNYYLVRK